MRYWPPGMKQALATKAGIRLAHLCDILARRRGCSPARAKLLEQCSQDLFDKPIPWQDWLFNKTTKHPAFSRKRRQP